MPCREIEIEIAPDGTVKGDIHGVKGPECREIARMLAEILGEEVSFEPSAEYYECETELDVDVENKY